MSRQGEQRVAAFFRRVERIRIEDLVALAATRPRAADLRDLDAAAARTHQRDAVHRIVADVEDYVRRADSGLGPIGPLGVPIQPNALSAADLGRLTTALSTAAAALLLADELDDATVGSLVGSFGALATD